MSVAPVIAQTTSGTITPFWQRIPKFFLFPFHLVPLAYAAFLALVSLLAVVMGFLGFIVMLGIALAALRYAFRIVEQTSLGFLAPEQYQRDAALETKDLPYKMLGIVVLWGLAGGLNDAVQSDTGLFDPHFHDPGATRRRHGVGPNGKLRPGPQSCTMDRSDGRGRHPLSGALVLPLSVA